MPTYQITYQGSREYKVTSSDGSDVSITILDKISGEQLFYDTYSSGHVFVLPDTDGWYLFAISNDDDYYIIENADGIACVEKHLNTLWCGDSDCHFSARSYWKQRIRVNQIIEYIRVLNYMCFANFLGHSEFPWITYTTQQKKDVYRKYLELVNKCSCHDYKKS